MMMSAAYFWFPFYGPTRVGGELSATRSTSNTSGPPAIGRPLFLFYDMTSLPSVQQLRVSIQGYAGAFHEAAAREHFVDHEVITVAGHTFADVIHQVETGGKRRRPHGHREYARR